MTTSTPVHERLIQLQPFDEFNQTLASHTHPDDWPNPTPSGRYNMVVIGGGTAGLVTAAAAAGLGARVALIERDLLGGDCLNIGCVPSKALIRCAHAAHAVRSASRFGVHVDGEPTIDFGEVMDHLRRERARISKHDSAKRFSDLGIDVYLGEGRFTGPNTVEVEGTTLEFVKACIATGGKAFVPPVTGIDETGFRTNESIFSLTTLPKRLGVLGGGPIGSELAQSFARLGSQVCLIEKGPHILVREDNDAAKIVQESLVRDGVDLHIEAMLVEAHTHENGKRLVIEDPGGKRSEMIVDELLVAVGRRPNVQNLGLEQAGVEFDEHAGIKVDDRLRSSNRNIFAAGDCCSKYKFTHAADAMARIVIQNAFFFGRKKVSNLIIPWCTYTDPEIAHVGMYLDDAKEAGIEVESIKIDLSDVDRAIVEGATEGFLKIHHRKGKDEIVGATMVAPHAGDMISEAVLAMQTGAGLGALSSTIHPYPTIGESFRKAGDTYNRGRLTPFVKRLFDGWFSWRR